MPDVRRRRVPSSCDRRLLAIASRRRCHDVISASRSSLPARRRRLSAPSSSRRLRSSARRIRRLLSAARTHVTSLPRGRSVLAARVQPRPGGHLQSHVLARSRASTPAHCVSAASEARVPASSHIASFRTTESRLAATRLAASQPLRRSEALTAYQLVGALTAARPPRRVHAGRRLTPACSGLATLAADARR